MSEWQNMDTAETDWSGVKPEVIDFVLEQAEKHLQAQFSTATAADGRAVTAASILAGLAGLAVASVATAPQVAPEGAWSILAGAATVFCGAAFCFMAARPVDFYVPGNQPEQWATCLLDPLSESKGAEIDNYQDMINDNAASLERASGHLLDGLRLALSAPVVGSVVYLVTSLIS
jgi:hypothetical protein